MPSFTQTDLQPKTRHGFSLIEAAIVLAIVGLVIGGIWVAASAVMDRMKYDEMIKGIGFIASSVSQKIPSSTYLTATQQAGNGVVYLQHPVYSRTAIDMGVVPKDWVHGTSVISPYGTEVVIFIFDTNMFEIVFNMPTAACLQFAGDQMNIPHFYGGFIGSNQFGTDSSAGGYPLSYRKLGCAESATPGTGTFVTFER